ncbi:glycosyltransferase family 1 protein, partial [Pseudomonas sp. MDMC224]
MVSEQAAGKRIIFIPRRLVEKNGVHYAIRSLLLLPESYVFWISGDGPFAEPIRDFSVKNGIQQRVRMLGAQPNEIVLALMHQANIVLVPSIPVHGVVEATSIAALEAMALGKPLVATRIGGLAEMIQDRITGLLYEPGSLGELVGA